MFTNGIAAPTLGSAQEQNSAGAGLDYSPAREVAIAAGATETVEFRGQMGESFAWDRVLAAGDLEAVTATARYNEGTQVFFKDVHLSALRNLTRFRRLKGLMQIGQNDVMQLELTNRSGAEANVNVQLAGYGSEAAIQEQRACLEATYGYVPKVELLTGFETLAAGAEEVEIQVRRSYAVRFRRFFIASDQASDIRAELKLYSDTVLEQVRLSQIEDRFLFHEAPSPFVLDASTPLSVVLTNGAAEEAHVSVVFEGYREENDQP